MMMSFVLVILVAMHKHVPRKNLNKQVKYFASSMCQLSCLYIFHTKIKVEFNQAKTKQDKKSLESINISSLIQQNK